MADLFSILSPVEQLRQVHQEFRHNPASGWWTAGDIFVGKNEEDVIVTLLELKEAEIAGIGDCISGLPHDRSKAADCVHKG